MSMSNSRVAGILLSLSYRLNQASGCLLNAATAWEERRHRRMARQDYKPVIIPAADIAPPCDKDDVLNKEDYMK